MTSDIELTRLLPHPENSNRMDADTLRKLRRHVERTGRYEPLVVRPHPSEDAKYQILNGHHRLQVLKAIGYQYAKCIVWEVDDDQARLYLATLNRLSGEDTPERRALLIDSLLGSFGLDDLAELLPENRGQLEELERLAHVDIDELPASVPDEHEDEGVVILEFFMDRRCADEVNLALELAVHVHKDVRKRSEALVHLARSYLQGHGSSTENAEQIVGREQAATERWQ